MVDVLIRPRFEAEVTAASIRRAALAALRHQAAPPQSSLCIVVTDDAEIQALNSLAIRTRRHWCRPSWRIDNC